MNKIRLSKYEKKQIEEIKKWGNKKPGKIEKKINDYLGPVFNKITDVLPKSFMKSFMDILNGVGGFLAFEKDICKAGKVDSVADLVNKDLETCDKLANSVQNWAKGIAGLEGAVTGASGAIGVLADIPGLLTLALRTIHKTGLCYGFKVDSETDKIQILEILCLANSATVGEKNYFLSGESMVSLFKASGEAVAVGATKSATEKVLIKPISENAIKAQQRKVLEKTAKKAAEKTAKKAAEKTAKKAVEKSTKKAVERSAEKAVERSGQQIVERETSKVVPAVGAVIGLAVNVNYISDVSWAARRCFQKWWLEENGKWDNSEYKDAEKKPIFEFDAMDEESGESE
ncbi:MAG: EcsC family protein [Succiniclasticum sp.]|uniref:EcsC family protein n=1 Tax=Succiniclasticum sp. TaxID=2775030 RepID=UPI002A9171D1|nr:EcsC family protein [Succiniclasticum sp.]MDY6291106.1 EcsC family protein [Succiniclasticum sp.]